MCWIYLTGTVGSTVSKGLCGKVSEVTSLKKFLTILRTLNTEFSWAAPPDPHYWDLKKNPLFQNPAYGPEERWNDTGNELHGVDQGMKYHWLESKPCKHLVPLSLSHNYSSC